MPTHKGARLEQNCARRISTKISPDLGSGPRSRVHAGQDQTVEKSRAFASLCFDESRRRLILKTEAACSSRGATYASLLDATASALPTTAEVPRDQMKARTRCGTVPSCASNVHVILGDARSEIEGRALIWTGSANDRCESIQRPATEVVHVRTVTTSLALGTCGSDGGGNRNGGSRLNDTNIP